MRLFDEIAGRLPWAKKARISPRAEPVNVSADPTVSRIQSAIRAAEGGDTRELFAFYRDVVLGDTHVQAQFNTRKLAMLAQPISVLPADKTKPDDVKAALACTQMIKECENWLDGLTHLMDGCLWPVAVAEKLFAPSPVMVDRPVPVQFILRRLEPVNPTLLCFRERRELGLALPEQEAWEPDLRFWATDAEGRIVYNVEQAYAADPGRHVVHRGHLLVTIRDNWGGPMRAVLGWWLLGILGRDWFARAMERYGMPFLVGHTDATNAQAIEFLREAFGTATKLCGLVVDHETQVELKEAMLSGLADAFEKFLSIVKREISKLIVGQELSSTAAPTGMGSGVAKLQGEVREDIRLWDQMRLGFTLQKQVFEPYLRVNGLRGSAPKLVWGGLSDEDAKTLAELLKLLKDAGWEPTDAAVPTLQERLGFEIQRVRVAPAGLLGGARANGAEEAGSGEVRAARANGEEAGSGISRRDAETQRKEGTEPLMSPRVRARLALLSAQERMAERMGVPGSWLNPVRDFLEELQAKAADATLSEQDLLDFMESAVKRVPELFRDMDVDALAEVLEAGMGEAVVGEVRRSLRQGAGSGKVGAARANGAEEAGSREVRAARANGSGEQRE
jgi:phage gp29-like protein